MGGGDTTTTTVKDEVAENNAGGGGETVTINVRCSNGSKFSVQVSLDSTVGSFKSVLSQPSDIPAEQQRLIYKGRILKDDQTLTSYGLEADHTVHLVRGFAAAASASATNAGNPNTNQNIPGDAPPNVGGPFAGVGGAPLFPGLGSGGGPFGAGLPDFEQVQQQLTQNPDMMRDMMNMPLVQNLMNNPEIIRNLIMNNPQMREIMDRNPELAHILNDPSTLRQTMEAARNPEIMREMMRNTDRAMSNIESSPEGFNMLRRMYENVQEPFLNATTMAGDTRNDSGANPFAALLGAQGGQAGNQATSPPVTGSETTANPPAPNTNPLPNPWASAGTGAAQMNTTARSNAAADTRAPPLGGFGALPDLQRMLGGMPDASSLNQLMQNPAISQMMQSLLSNPQYMNQISGFNPQLRSMLDSNPHLREMMQNPEFIRQLTSPETMQQVMSLQQGLLSQLGRQQTNQGQGQDAGRTVPPEELYATQLAQLQEMGFFDTQENIRALIATAGNVHAAVERLLGNTGQ
ncbi:ubiquitin domain-containing protein DSK2b isoform X2 [Nicotiana tabacum]|uniref:Ubiquitin domain-containing protein DSK2b isoform X2 n=1 Tax=Nicotiana tabacum TaxID=4097 RepID=A0AC58U7W1_TOBAC